MRHIVSILPFILAQPAGMHIGLSRITSSLDAFTMDELADFVDKGLQPAYDVRRKEVLDQVTAIFKPAFNATTLEEFEAATATLNGTPVAINLLNEELYMAIGQVVEDIIIRYGSGVEPENVEIEKALIMQSLVSRVSRELKEEAMDKVDMVGPLLSMKHRLFSALNTNEDAAESTGDAVASFGELQSELQTDGEATNLSTAANVPTAQPGARGSQADGAERW